MKSFEYTGEWWLPTQNDNKVAGTLTFSPQDRVRLNLTSRIDCLTFDDVIRSSSEFISYPLILGLTSDGQAVSLVDCMETENESGIDDEVAYVRHKCSAAIAFIGAHFTEPQEGRFSKLEAYYSFLPQWAGRFPFLGHQGPVKEVSASTTKGVVSVKSITYPEHMWIEKEVLPHSVWIEFDIQQNLSLEEWLAQYIAPLQDLISLATQRPNSLFGVRVYPQQEAVVHQTMTTQDVLIDVFFSTSLFVDVPSRKLFPEALLFTLKDVTDDFSAFIEAWLKVSKELDSVCSLFFGVQYNIKMFLQHQFLSIAQAAESYHRRRSTRTKDLQEDEHNRRLEAILAGTPEQYKEWLTKQLKYSNEPSFRHRITDLINGAGEVMVPLIGSSNSAKNAFIDKVCKTRNYLTHYDRSLETEAARGENLYWLTQYLYILVLMCLLHHELDFSIQECIEMFRNNETYQFALLYVQQSR